MRHVPSRQHRPLLFPVGDIRIRDTGDCIEARVNKPVGGKLSGKGIKIKAGKVEEWLPVNMDWLRREFHTNDMQKIVDILSRRIDTYEKNIVLPVDILEREVPPEDLDAKARRRLKKMSKNQIEIEAVLTGEVDSGFKYSKMRRVVTDQILSAETKDGKRVFEDVVSVKFEKEKDTMKAIARLDRNTVKIKGEGRPKEDVIIHLTECLEAALSEKEIPEGAIGIDYIINVEAKE